MTRLFSADTKGHGSQNSSMRRPNRQYLICVADADRMQRLIPEFSSFHKTQRPANSEYLAPTTPVRRMYEIWSEGPTGIQSSTVMLRLRDLVPPTPRHCRLPCTRFGNYRE